MAVRFILQLLSLGRLHRSAQPEQIQGYRVHTLRQSVSPFSFFRNIYLNPALHAPHALPGILRHEAVHVRQWHTLDVMLGAAVQIFAWFNPAAWLLQHAIRENLEFITDRTLLREGMNAQQYQYSLLEVNGIPTATAIANNFNFSSLKNRIKMMNKQRSAQYQVLRYTIPVMAALALVLVLNASKAALMPVKDKIISITAPLLSAPADTAKPKIIKDGPFKGKQEPVIVKDSVVAAPGSNGIGVVTPGKAVTLRGTVTQRTASTATVGGADEVTVVGYGASTAARRDTGARMMIVTEGADGKVTRHDTIYGEAQRIRITGNPAGGQPLYLLDGKVIDLRQMQTINPDDIEAISVLKDKAATAIYGSAGENGVILISTKAASKK